MNKTLILPKTDQLVFFNNLRTFTIILVIAFHASLSFLPGNTWYVNDTSKHVMTGIIISILDVFIMPVLFFLSGYFVIQSYISRGFVNFVRSKLKLLFVPYIVFAVISCPIISYIGLINLNIKHDLLFKNYFYFFIHYIKSAFSLNYGFYNKISLANEGIFNISYLWFLLILLIFFLITAIFFYFTKIEKEYLSNKKINIGGFFSSIYTMYGMLFIISFVAFYSVNIILPDKSLFGDTPWYRITPLLSFQTSRLVMYITFYIAGIYSYYNELFTKKIDSKRIILLWITLSLLSVLILLKIMSVYFINNVPGKELKLLYSLAHVLLAVSITGLLITLFFKYQNKTSSLKKSLSDNSYNMYLVHLPLVIIIQQLMSKFSNLNCFLELLIIFVISTTCSYLISNYILKPERFKY